MQPQLEALVEYLTPWRYAIQTHPLYAELVKEHNLQSFMTQHVFIVWDFMSLIKELYRRLVVTTSPWLPPKDPVSAHFISEILLEEESDKDENQNYSSHFDMYQQAMKSLGADCKPIENFIAQLKQGQNVGNAITEANIHEHTKAFIQTTSHFFQKSSHELAAAFVFGREGITLAMFTPLLKQLENKLRLSPQPQYAPFIYYLRRHIQLDDTEHFPKALRLLSRLINKNEDYFYEAKQAAITALNARLAFLSGLYRQFTQ